MFFIINWYNADQHCARNHIRIFRFLHVAMKCSDYSSIMILYLIEALYSCKIKAIYKPNIPAVVNLKIAVERFWFLYIRLHIHYNIVHEREKVN